MIGPPVVAPILVIVGMFLMGLIEFNLGGAGMGGGRQKQVDREPQIGWHSLPAPRTGAAACAVGSWIGAPAL